jgi:hypothetical protein
MNAVLYFAMGLTAATAGVGIAAIVNAIRLNREKHGEVQPAHGVIHHTSPR